MPSNLEARLSKLEASRPTAQRTHEQWVDLLDAMPPRGYAESAAAEARTDAEIVAEYGSLTAAATAARARAAQSRDWMDGLLAEDIESRAQGLAQPEPFQGHHWSTGAAQPQDEDRYRY